MKTSSLISVKAQEHPFFCTCYFQSRCAYE